MESALETQAHLGKLRSRLLRLNSRWRLHAGDLHHFLDIFRGNFILLQLVTGNIIQRSICAF